MTDSRKAILVVSFGTSFNDNRARTIGAVESDVAKAFPDCEVRRAFTSRMIIAKLLKRDNEKVDTVSEALEHLADDGFSDVIVQPTHVMNGIEYEDVVNSVTENAGMFASIRIGAPLLTTFEDYQAVLEFVRNDVVPFAEEAAGGSTAVVFMGHGTTHYANATYSQLQMMFMTEHLSSVYITTVEGYPGYQDTLRLMDGKGIRKVVILPFMLVAGDHANNDMAGDGDESMRKVFSKAGYDVTCVVKGMGEFPGFRRLFINHVRNAMSD